MNQILVTKKLYITPELRRKKKIYRFQFFFCVFLVCLLFSYYIYAEYDRTKSEEVSQEILEGITLSQENNIDTTVKPGDDIIVVALDNNTESPEIVQLTSNLIIENQQEQQDSQTSTQTSSSSTNSSNQSRTVNYKTNKGVDYTIEAKIRYPRLGIDYPVIAESSPDVLEALLKISINKYWGPEPNAVGNYCVVGHNYKNKTMFGRLSEAVNGDIVEVEDMSGRTVQYSVYDRFSVEPDDTSCTSQLTNGRREVTLITCTNYGKQRLVVKAREIK